MLVDLILPTLAALSTTVALIIKYLDRRAKERAILAAVTDEQREDINSIPPLSLVFVLTLATGLLCCAAFAGQQVRAMRQAEICKRDCESDKDCRPPSICRRGACVDSAEESRQSIAMYYPSRRNDLTPWSPINGH